MARGTGALAERLTSILHQRRVPGGSFAVFGLERPTTIVSAGVRRTGGSDPVKRRDHWHVGSVGKAMTATMVTRLHDQGRLDLCESVMSGLAGTEFERRADARHFGAVRIADLLTHRAGVRANPTYPMFARYVLLGLDKDSVNRAATVQALTRGIGPGGQYLYSNAGYGLAGLIAAHRTGRSWEQLIIDHIREPFGVNSLGFGRPEWHGEQPWGHRRRLLRPGYTEFPISKRGLDLEIMRPAGDIHLTLKDLAHWGRLNLATLSGENAGLVSEASARRLFGPVDDTIDPQRHGRYAMGWHVENSAPEFGGEPLIWHNGSDLFSFTLLGLLPEQGLGFAWVTNALQKKWRTDPSLVWEPVADLFALAER